MTEPLDIETYQGYKGLPPLVDLMPVSEALVTGLTVADSVDRLKFYHWALKRLHGIFTSRLTAEPVYELKMAYALHAHYCVEHQGDMATRVREMREPPYGLDKAPHAALDLFFDEIQCAPNTEALVLGLYGHAIPSLVQSLKKQIDECNLLFEHPTYRVLRWTLVELEDVATYGAQALKCLIDDEDRRKLSDWSALLNDCLTACGGLDGTGGRTEEILAPLFSKEAYRYDPVPRRDERFKDSYNMGVNAEVFLHDPEQDPGPKTLMLYFKRMREIDVPEMMASIIHETPGKPWGYYKDMGRQLWDEARHAMMGELGFLQAGIAWQTVPLTFAWSLGLNTMLTAKERHAVLFFIEQGLMPNKTGKKAEWEIAVASATPLAELIQDYDWADEILHARIGRDWLVSEIGGQKETMEYGSAAWDRAYADMEQWRKDGLTEHRNWWPDLYTAACRNWGIEPDPKVLAFDTSYAETRADLQRLPAE